MKRTWAIAMMGLFLCSILGSTAQAAEPQVSAVSAILIDADTGRVLYEKNAHEQRLIASITKLMTALVAVESTPNLTELVTIKRESTLAEGSSMYLRVGEQLPLETLLYGLLLVSGNDAALAIADYCGGSVETFVDWMNQRGASLGMKNTHFANPNGLNDEAHYSTAADMARLAQQVLSHETLASIVATKSITLGERSMVNHNKLLWRYEGCIGMKTGYTERAGRTLVTCAERNGQRLIAVTLTDPNDWRDHAALLDYGFETFSRQVLATGGKEFRRVPLTGSLTHFIPVRTECDVYYPLTKTERVRAVITLPKAVAAPVQEGTIARSLTFYLGKKTIGTTYLLYDRDAKRDVVASRSLKERVMEFLSGKKTFLAAFYGDTMLRTR